MTKCARHTALKSIASRQNDFGGRGVVDRAVGEESREKRGLSSLGEEPGDVFSCSDAVLFEFDTCIELS